MNESRYRHTMVLLKDGTVFIPGGHGEEGVLAKTEVYTP